MNAEQVRVFFNRILPDEFLIEPAAAVLLILGGVLIGGYIGLGMISKLFEYIKTRKEKKLFYDTRKKQEYHRDER